MPYELDPDLVKAGAASLEAGLEMPAPAARGDWQALRSNGEASVAGIEVGSIPVARPARGDRIRVLRSL